MKQLIHSGNFSPGRAGEQLSAPAFQAIKHWVEWSGRISMR
jgi:hypothetical protein